MANPKSTKATQSRQPPLVEAICRRLRAAIDRVLADEAESRSIGWWLR